MAQEYNITTEPPSWWNDHVDEPRQTSYYCKLNKTSKYFLVGNKGLCFQVLKKGPFKMAKSFFPILDDSLLDLFLKYCKENKFHPLIHQYSNLQIDKDAILIDKLKSIKLSTVIVDLKKDDLWMLLDKKQRNRIRRAKEKNLIFKEAMSKEEWLSYYRLYKETAERKKIKFYSEEYLNEIFNLGRNFSKLFFIEYNSSPICYAQLYVHKKFIFLNTLANAEISYELNANALLIWETIMWGKQNNFELFDLGGIDENAIQDSPQDRINKFKLSFGPRVDFNEYTDSWVYLRLRPIYGKLKNSWLGRFIFTN
ncbi:peptidoglycan bridge formation glycyltransferase FemA/FemB family protein [Candidatus Woesearchaeota archaeon]|nr:peptidoglycan bridge formation glycyltransferase FemA/FemB family protein [Candidatus Woesearchaeota archaeon]